MQEQEIEEKTAYEIHICPKFAKELEKEQVKELEPHEIWDY